MTVLFDTCVIIDALQRREPFFKEAETLFLLIANRQIEGFITAKSATDIHYLTHRNTHSNERTQEIMASLFSLFGLLDTFGIDCQNALFSGISDYEDAVMEETARRTGMNCIITRNIRDYARAALPVYTPEAFIKLLEAQAGEE